MKQIIILSIFWSFGQIVFAQSVDYSKFNGEAIKISGTSPLKQPYFRVYGNMRLEQYVKLNTGNAALFTDGPEQILTKVYQAANNSELKSLFHRDTKVDLANYKSKQAALTDTARNFFLLNHKLTFTLSDGQELSIIKYTEYLDSVAAETFTIQVYCKDSQCYGVKMLAYNDIEYAMSKISDREFWSLSKKSKLTEDDFFISESTLAKVKDNNGILNLTKLAAVIRDRNKMGKKGISD